MIFSKQHLLGLSCLALTIIFSSRCRQKPVLRLPVQTLHTLQQPAKVVSPPWQLAFDHFTVEEGLCGNNISDIYQDNQGFLWIGTEGGLNRYDGYSFKAYQHDPLTPGSLPANEVLRVREDTSGSLWVLTIKGLSLLMPDDTFRTWYDSLSLHDVNSNLTQMVIDRKGRIWIRGEHFLFYFDITTKEFVRALNYEAKPVLRQTDGTLFAFGSHPEMTDANTLHRKVLQWEESNSSFKEIHDTLISTDPSKGLDFLDATFDEEGNLWACRADSSLLHYDFHTHHYTKISPLQDVENRFNLCGKMLGMCYSVRNNLLWIGGYGGVVRYDLNNGAPIPIIRYQQNSGEADGLPGHVVNRIIEDRSGNIWVGMIGSGLCRFAPTKRKFHVFQRNACAPSPLPDNKINALCYDLNGQLWVGTDNGLGYLDDVDRGTFVCFLHKPRTGAVPWTEHISAIALDSISGRLYMGYWGRQPDCFDPSMGTFKYLTPKNISPPTWERWHSVYIYSLTSDHERGFLYGTLSGGPLQQYKPASGIFTWYGWATWEAAQQAGMLSYETTVVYRTRDGLLWMGNDQNRGLLRVDLSKPRLPMQTTIPALASLPVQPLDGALRTFKPKIGDSTALQHGTILDILEDRVGRLWLATNAGLHLMLDRERGIFQYFGKAQGLPNEIVSCLIEDTRGRLWLGTNNGLCCFDPERGRVMAVFTTQDGLPDNAFTARACTRGPQGQLAFGTSKGFCLFHPDSLLNNDVVPTLALSNLQINGVERPVQSQGTVLAYTEKNLTFDFTALDFSNPHANRYQFYLEGFDPGWPPPTSEHRAIYTNLAPGDYTFWVKGTNNDGVWSVQPLRFEFTILPPWWATWWCRTVALLSSLLLLAAFLRYRKERLRLKEVRFENEIRYHQVQTLQAQMGPHSISNILGAIKHEVLIKPPHEAVKQLGELSHLIRLFLDATVNTGLPSKGMSHNDIPLADEVEMLALYLKFEVLQRREKFRDQGFAIEIAPSVIVENLRVPPMVIQPFVENAVRHGIRYLDKGFCGFIWVRFSREDDVLTCIIEDDGVGRDTAARIQEKSQNIYVSHGTRLVRERVAILNQMDYDIQFNTIDRPGGGTIVTITFRD